MRRSLPLTVGLVLVLAGTAAARVPFVHSAQGGGDIPIKIGLIGCGGRGTGAVLDALGAAAKVIYPAAGYHTEDVAEGAKVEKKDIRVVALADLFEDRLGRCRQQLAKLGIDIPQAMCFTGFDAYKQLLTVSEVNYVIQATSPHFRPMHLKAAIEAGGGKYISNDAKSSAETQASNVENLIYAPTNVVGLLSDPGSQERAQLVLGWRSALDSLARGGEGFKLSGPEQINIYRSRVALQRLEVPDAPLPPALLEEARQTVARVTAAAPGEYARHAAVNAAGNLYFEAGLDDEADSLLVAEIEKSKSPYYFMVELADLAKKAGREADALRWLERAYADAKGPATRFQWGYNYLAGLLEMTPEDTARIERVGLEVLGELADTPDAFYQRTRLRLDQLSTKLLDWGQSGDAAKVVGALRDRTATICAGLPEGDEGRASCERFLKSASPASQGA